MAISALAASTFVLAASRAFCAFSARCVTAFSLDAASACAAAAVAASSSAAAAAALASAPPAAPEAFLLVPLTAVAPFLFSSAEEAGAPAAEFAFHVISVEKTLQT